MMPVFIRQIKICITTAGALLALAAPALGQAGQNPKPPQPDDVVRVYSALVQTDVMVFDKEGHFVNGLKREDFELRIDGKPRSVEFFEPITAGTGNEEVQLSAARGLSSAAAASVRPVPLDRGRTIFFYVDDFHLSAGSLHLTQKLLLHFIEQDMGQNDEAAITSASGEIGFLQQLSDNKAVLRAALSRLTTRSFSVRDIERPPMSEYQALQIDRYDRELLDYFIEALQRDNPQLPRDAAAAQVRARASSMLHQAASITTNTLAGLESLVRSSSSLPGRKLVFFISDGFFLDDRNSDSIDRLRKITSAAARSGVVIYSMDARGLVASLVDASTDVAFDPSGRISRASIGELSASQDVMNALARDTGGSPIFNTNALDVGLSKALKETSVYYLLAWRPEPEEQGSAKFRHIAVNLVGHPGLTVRVRRGFFDLEPPATAKQPTNKPQPEQPMNDSQAKTSTVVLRQALSAVHPNPELPVALHLGFVNTVPKGIMLTASMQVSTDSLTFALEDGKQKAQVDVVGSVYDHQGKAGAAFNDRMTITASSLEQLRRSSRELIYNYPVYLPPGLYQVRVGARDPANGKMGTAYQWIEIPNLSAHQLGLSSLTAGERPPSTSATTSDQNGLPTAILRVDHRFHRNSFLRFLVYVYNAAVSPADSKPDVALQVQILRDGQPVVTTPSKRVSSENVQQLDRIPYGGDISLEGLAAGRYLLRISVVDRVSKSSAAQELRFEVE